MRIHCPYCGLRDLSEFSYLGDAAYARPQVSGADDQARYVDAVYLRDNPAGVHAELWYHQYGCRAWLTATRNTRTHEFNSVHLVVPRGAS